MSHVGVVEIWGGKDAQIGVDSVRIVDVQENPNPIEQKCFSLIGILLNKAFFTKKPRPRIL